MLVYCFMIILTLFFSLLANNDKKDYSRRKICILLVFMILFLVMGLRYEIGKDYVFTYRPSFEKILNGNTNLDMEFGYIILVKIISLFSSDYAWLFIVTSFIIIYCMFKSILDNSKNFSLSIFILICGCFYFYAMNVVRQSIAISIFIYSIKFIKNREFKKYIIAILLASTMHKIALLFIPIYFIKNINIDKKKFLISSLIIYLLIPKIIGFVSIFLADYKYGNYISGYYLSTDVSNIVSPIINFALIIAFFMLDRKDNNDEEYNLYKNIHIVGFWVSLFFGTIPLISRIFVNFYHIQILSIPYLISKFKNNNTKTILIVICYILFFINFIYSVGIKNGNEVLPYNWIFNR